MQGPLSVVRCSWLRGTLSEVLRFFRAHWIHFVLLVPGAVLFTVFHEACHAYAVVLQGGTVTEFVWLPAGSEWGHVAYVFPAGVRYWNVAVAVAPYCASAVLCTVVLLAACLGVRRPRWLVTTLFFWLFLAPVADIANVALGYLAGAENDLSHAFGAPGPMEVMVLVVLGIAAAVTGYFVQRRLYGDSAAGAGAYIVLGGIALCILGGLTLVRF